MTSMSTLPTLLALFVVGYAPGAALFRLPALDRDRRAALDAEERVFWAATISVAWSSAVILALAACGWYTFTALAIIDAALTLLIALAFRGRLRLGPARARAARSAWLPMALIALGAWLFFPPFEHVLGGKDPGTYVNEGVQLARQGTLILHDTVVAAVPAAFGDLFYPSHNVGDYYGLRFMGFLILDPRQGTVVGQFPHGFPAWIAVGYAVGGIRGALATTPVAALLGVLAVYFAGARLLGKGPAFAGAALLTMNVATVWFAREPNSEVVAQALLFAALLAFARSQIDGDPFFAPVAAVLYGLLLFLRFDMVLALGSAGAVAAMQLFDGRRPRVAFVVPAGLGAGLAWLYLTRVMTPYAMYPLEFMRQHRTAIIAAAAVAATGLVPLVLVARHARVAAIVRRAVPALLVLTVLAAAVYAYFFRVEIHGKLAFGDARSLEVFTWYFPPFALAVALAGYALVVWRDFWRAPALLMTAAVYCLFLFYKLHVVHEHFWAARRFVPVILPAASLMFAAILATAARARWPALRTAAVGTAVVVTVLLGGQLLRAERAIANHVEYGGALARLDDLARKFTRDDLVVFESRNSGSDLHVLALPLQYCWQQPVLVLDSPVPDKPLFRRFLDDALRRYRHVYFVGGGGTNLISASIRSVPVLSERFQLPEYESRLNVYPREVRHKEFDFGIYAMTPASSRVTDFALDVGRLDDLNVVRFHAKEQGADGVPFRWSQRRSYIAVPPLASATRLTIWMSDGGRPKTTEPADVTVSMNGKTLGTVRVTTEFRPYSFDLARNAVVGSSTNPDDAALVQLTTTTWTPRTALGTADDRDLGVMVRRVEIK
jgi:hypothetical protein